MSGARGDVPTLLAVSEITGESGVSGLRGVRGPLFPVEGSVADFIADCARSSSPGAIRASIEAIERLLSGETPAVSTAERSLGPTTDRDVT